MPGEVVTVEQENARPAVAEGPSRAMSWRGLPVLFLAIAGLAGVCLAVTVPLGRPPDEGAHYLRIWTLSHGKVVDDVHADGTAGADIPPCISRLMLEISSDYVSEEPVHFAHLWRRTVRCEPGQGPSTFVGFGNSAVNSPVVYLPQAAAMAVLSAIHQPPRTLALGARLAALAAFLALVGFALAISRRARTLLFVVGCLPATVGLASTLSSDTIVLALAVLSVALLVRLRTDPTAPRWLRGVLAAALIALALGKNSYELFLLLWFLVPQPEDTPVRRLVRWAWVPVVGTLLAGVWSLQVRDVKNFPTRIVDSRIDPAKQLSHVVHDPISFVGVLWRSVGSTDFFTGILPRVLGRYPSGRPEHGVVHSPPVPPWMLVLMLVALGVGLAVEIGRRRANPSIAAPIVTAVIVVGSFLLVYLLVYSVASPPGGPTVALMQGRYFTPLLPLLAIPVVERWDTSADGSLARRLAGGWTALAMAAVLVGELFSAYTMYYR